MTIRFIDEHRSHRGGRLGRHVEHDPRSRAYALSEDLLPSTYTSATHTVRIPVLDQGDLGSCTGNAAEALVGSDPLYAAIPTTVTARPTGDAGADERQAVALYSAATRLDQIRGQYPPTDTGSTGLAVAKAAQRAGLISGYQHALSLDAALKALTAAPLIVGVSWYEGFDSPDAKGLVKVSGSVRGGHEFLLYGIDAENKVVLARNSWGTSWGRDGCFSFSFDDFGRLLEEDGDATLFVPLSSPAPTPTPTPTPTDVDAQLLAAFQTWCTAKGI
ncbi:C1 family peptidase [Streptomyces sp. NPDC019937]|uniref:C1 family peptidase n=1 Tax=Streptomyces sp. NPDC019937 TaxID=3154787 RepID=UPI0033F69920